MGVAVLVGTWAAGEAAVPSGEVFLTASLVGMEGENTGLSWWNTTWHMTGVALMATTLFSPTLVMGLGAVISLSLTLYRGSRGTWLQHSSEKQPLIQSRTSCWHSQESACLYIVSGECVQYCQAPQRFELVL